ncbi:MAG: PucR family transcriptional regulator [Clostridia bacterium]|nr:PucR family transcriptional regulator [Clostridia bacterium]
MKVTINDCLKLDSFAKAKFLAGQKNGENRITSISVMDAGTTQDAVKYNGVLNQLVLTSFAGMRSDVLVQKRTIAELVRRGVAGLVVFCNTKGVSILDNSVIATAEELGMPLLAVPYREASDYSDMLKEVTEKILFGNNFDNRLINNTIYHLLNFEKYSNFQTAIREAAINNNFQVVLLSEEFNPVFSVETKKDATIADAVKLGRERELGKSQVYQLIDVNGVLTYWGILQINKENYFLFIVDNEDNYSSEEITKLAEIIEIAMAMWKFTPDRDAKSEFIKTLIRGNVGLAYSIKDEAAVDPARILSIFYAKNIDMAYAGKIVDEDGLDVLTYEEDEDIYGIIFADSQDKEIASSFYERLKETGNGIRVFHCTGLDGIEGAGDAFRLINETWTFVESVFPYKRVFTKYELALVSNCIQLKSQGGYLRKNYMDLLEPFKRETTKNKARQLLETLETFVLDAGMNGQKTAKFLGVHVNTVQYRLKRINEVLGAEITGNRVIPGLTMALALKRLEEVTQ